MIVAKNCYFWSVFLQISCGGYPQNSSKFPKPHFLLTCTYFGGRRHGRNLPMAKATDGLAFGITRHCRIEGLPPMPPTPDFLSNPWVAHAVSQTLKCKVQLIPPDFQNWQGYPTNLKNAKLIWYRVFLCASMLASGVGGQVLDSWWGASWLIGRSYYPRNVLILVGSPNFRAHSTIARAWYLKVLKWRHRCSATLPAMQRSNSQPAGPRGRGKQREMGAEQMLNFETSCLVLASLTLMCVSLFGSA